MAIEPRGGVGGLQSPWRLGCKAGLRGVVFDNGEREEIPEQERWAGGGSSAHDTWAEQGFGNLPRVSRVQIPRGLKRMGRGRGFRQYSGGREKTRASMIPGCRHSVVCVAV